MGQNLASLGIFFLQVNRVRTVRMVGHTGLLSSPFSPVTNNHVMCIFSAGSWLQEVGPLD
jgi:hypothetical protein